MDGGGGFGGSQVALLGLERATDAAIWLYAREHDYVIVSRDGDFEEISMLRGVPPQVVAITGGNASKAAVLNLLLTMRRPSSKPSSRIGGPARSSSNGNGAPGRSRTDMLSLAVDFLPTSAFAAAAGAAFVVWSTPSPWPSRL